MEAYDNLLRYLTISAPSNEENKEEVERLAVKAAVEAIRLPQVVQLDGLLALTPIQHLRQSHPQLFDLLRIFAEDSLSAYTSFYETHPSFLETVGASVLLLLKLRTALTFVCMNRN